MRNYFEEMNIDYDELKSYEEIETYYDEVKDYSNLIQELQCDRVEALKQIVNKNKEIERLNKENNILKKNAEHNDKVVDNVNWGNMLLKKEIERLKEEYVMLQNASDEVEEEKDKEIERLNKENKELNKICARKSHYIDKKDLEIGELNNIIDEIKERVLDETKPLPNAKEIIDIIGVDKE